MNCLLLSQESKATLVKEHRVVPTPDDVLGSLVNRLPDQPVQDKETCNLISTVFSNLAKAHRQFHVAARGLADIAALVSPQQLTLILAAVVPPTLQQWCHHYRHPHRHQKQQHHQQANKK